MVKHTTQLPADELTGIVGKIHDYQTAQAINDSDMLRRFTGLGSSKTYRRILDGDTSDLNVDRWLLDYRAVWALIESLKTSASETEALYDDLTAIVNLRGAFSDTLLETGNERLILIEGPSGAGKSKALTLLVSKYGVNRIKLCQANETWKDSPRAMLAEIARALGLTSLPVSTADLLRTVVEKLQASRVCVAIDEAQHLGPRTLNVVKTLLNETPGEFILAALNTLWRKLEMAAYEESRQLTRNRLASRINLTALAADDVAKYLDRARDWNAAELDSVVAVTINAAKDRGHFAFIKRLLRAARHKHGDEIIPAQDWAKFIAKQTEVSQRS